MSRPLPDARILEARDFLRDYQIGLRFLQLRHFERRRNPEEQFPTGDEFLRGNEAFWRARMQAVCSLIGAMKNGREKLILYYHYVQGESLERASDRIGFSRRTGYRLHQKGLLIVSFLLENRKKREEFDIPSE